MVATNLKGKTMLEKFEEQKIVSYIANALSHTAYIQNNLKNICEWIFSENQKYFDCKLLADNESDFMALARKNKQKAIAKIKKAALEFQKIPLICHKYQPSSFERNLQYIQQIFKLKNDEKEFLGFLIRENCSAEFDDILDDIQKYRRRAKRVNKGMFLKLNPDKIYAITRDDGALSRFQLIDCDMDGDIEAAALSKQLYSQKFKSLSDVKQYLLGKPLTARLEWEDFSHIKHIDVLKHILKTGLSKKETGINILLYGEPGTGKTEFAKTLALQVGASLYAIGESAHSFINKWEENRYAQLLRTQAVLKKDSRKVLVIDEADDVLGGCDMYFFKRRHPQNVSKIKINRLLETNINPCIWITNNIADIDKAYLRRFTYAVNFTRPTKSVQENMWRKNLQTHCLPCDVQTTKRFANKYSISPSFISSAVKSAKLINGGLAEIEQTLDALQEAYNNGNKITPKQVVAGTAFNPLLLNTDTDLNHLAERLVKLNRLNFSICLYGASGTGKSAFAQYLGEKLNIPVIKKRCSDLQSKYVGDTEKNIAEAFQEAQEQGALLIFDEADSFLQDRTFAVRSWEITQVNEMLIQMEKHPYPFVCTTNLMERLDKASMRRFTFKVKYDYLTEAQRTLCFEHFFNIKNVDLTHLNALTPGDFVVVKDKAEILNYMSDTDKLIEMLEQEQQNKAPICSKIGFVC